MSAWVNPPLAAKQRALTHFDTLEHRRADRAPRLRQVVARVIAVQHVGLRIRGVTSEIIAGRSGSERSSIISPKNVVSYHNEVSRSANALAARFSWRLVMRSTVLL